jgi:uncharacterized protein with HEPN domain
MYLEDMNLAMERIAEYIHGYSFIQFKHDYKTVDAVIRNFEVIGEASNKIPKEFKNNHPEIPWNEMYLLRNKVSHEYFGIDYETTMIKNLTPKKLYFGRVHTVGKQEKSTFYLRDYTKVIEIIKVK